MLPDRSTKHVLLVLQVVLKGPFQTLYMPVWSYAEVAKALPIYEDVESDVASELFRKFGGVVRYSRDIAFKLHAKHYCFLQMRSGLAGLS